MSSLAVEVCVETVGESTIQEVTLDGQEIYVQPLSMSENLKKLAEKIDFSKDESDEKGKPTSEGEKEEVEEKPITPFQPSLWPWDSIRTKLKGSLTEMNVLMDVLSICKEKRYMVLDPVQQDAPESRMAFTLLAKKKCLQSAASIILSGAERLRKSHMELNVKRAHPDFHFELLRLRQNWRLKKVGNVILGDLSYKSAGSRFWQGGTFEVTKSEVDASDIENPAITFQRSPLQVTVPSELEGVAYIQVTVKRVTDNTDLASVDLKLPTDGTVPSDVHWQRKLEAAQHVIFCKEVFQQLAKEATQVRSVVPHMVVGNQIFCHLFPGEQLQMALCHYTEKDKRSSNTQQPAQQKLNHNYVLEHSLHHLLRENHCKNMYVPLPHPVTALMGMSKRRRLAGPHSYNRADLLNLSQNETLLEKIIHQAKHIILRKKALGVIDKMAQTIPDPQITVHSSNISSATESLIKVNITSQNYETVRATVALHIGVDDIKAVCKDGRVVNLSYEMEELKDFLICQIAQHHISTVHHLSKIMGWTALSIDNHMGVSDMEAVGNPLSILLASPNGDRVLSIRSGPVSGLRVFVQTCPRLPEENGSTTIVKDKKWAQLGGPFREVHLEKMEGRNFINKVELLMGCLAKEHSALSVH